jgi:[protein-PII] uridylyltransferase
MYLKDFKNKPIISIHNEKDLETTEVSIMSQDSFGLFSKLTGALSSMDINIVNAKIFTNSKGIAVDVVWIQDSNNKPIREKKRLERIKSNIINFIDGEKIIEDIPVKGFNDKRINAFSVPVAIKIMNNISSDYTVIEVSGKDRPRILYDLANSLNKMELNLFRAQVATFGERVVDVFYVLDPNNKRIEHHQSKKSIINKLSKIF